MKTYREEIRILREERDDENLRERDLVRNIIAIWKEIRNLRTTQKYSNTSHKIIIHKVFNFQLFNIQLYINYSELYYFIHNYCHHNLSYPGIR